MSGAFLVCLVLVAFPARIRPPFPSSLDKANKSGKLQPPALKQLLAHMAAEGSAAADPPKQGAMYLLYWRKPEEWGQLIYDWVSLLDALPHCDRSASVFPCPEMKCLSSADADLGFGQRVLEHDHDLLRDCRRRPGPDDW